MADQLCTTQNVKDRIGITDATDDGLISSLIDQVSAQIEGITGRKLVPDNAATYVFDTEAGYVLRIPRGIRSITSIGVATQVHQPDSGGTYSSVPTGDVILRPKVQDLPDGWPFLEVRISRGVLSGTVSAFYRIDNGCQITGNFGFAATPTDVTAVTIDAVVAAYQLRKNGAGAVIGADGIPATSPEAAQRRAEVLGRYRFAALG